MTVGTLKELLKEADDDMVILISPTPKFEGVLITPCEEESGVAEVSLFTSQEEEDEARLLAKPLSEKAFLIVPHGFAMEAEGPDPALN